MKTFRIMAGGLLLIAMGLAHGAASDSWPVYQHDVGHTGYVPQTLLPSLAAPMWSQVGQIVAPSGIAVADGIVVTTPTTYFNATAPMVAQSIDDGHIVWSQDFGSVFSVNQPAIDNGLIYLQTSNNGGATFLHCYQVDGTFLWRAPFDSQWEHYLGPIVVDGIVYFDGGYYGGMYSFDGISGVMNWYSGLPQYDSWSPTWADGLLIAYTDELDIIAPSTGLNLGTISDPNYSWSGYSPDQAPVVIGNLAYVTNGGRLVAFDTLNQIIAWTVAISASGQVATDGTELFLNSGGTLSARDTGTGAAHWSWVPTPTGSIASNIIVFDSHVVVGDGTSTYVVNRATHKTEQVFPAAGKLAYAADRLFIADTSGVVHAYFLPTDKLFNDAFE